MMEDGCTGNRLTSSCKEPPPPFHLLAPAHLEFFFAGGFCQMILGMGLHLFVSLSKFLLPCWQPENFFLWGATAASVVAPPWFFTSRYISWFALWDSVLGCASACCSSKICFSVLVASLTLGPLDKDAGGVSVIFERCGVRWFPPALLKTTA
jgi:hypothetical protein